MKRYNILYFLLLVFMATFTPKGWSKNNDKKIRVGIYCYYQDNMLGPQPRLQRLVDPTTQTNLIHEAKFDTIFQEYILEKSDYERYLSLCTEALEGKHLIDLKAASITTTGLSLYYYVGCKEAEIAVSSATEWAYFLNSYLYSDKNITELSKTGFANTFLALKESMVKRSSEELHNIKKLKIIFDDLPNQLEFSQNYSENFESIAAEFRKNQEEDQSREAFYTDQMRRDFNRIEVQIHSNDELIYDSELIKDSDDSLNYLEQPFALMQAYYEMQETKISSQLKENIGFALHSRTQGFDTPGLVRLYELVAQYGGKLEYGFGNIAKSRHIINLSPTCFSLMSTVRIALQAPHFKHLERFNVGHFDVTRTMVCDLLLNRCSPEQFFLQKSQP